LPPHIFQLLLLLLLQLSVMRSRMADDMMEAVNLTHRVERAVLEQRLEDAQQNLAIRDLRLDWVSFKASTRQ